MGLFSFLFAGLKLPVPAPAESKVPMLTTIENPRIGFFNLQGAEGNSLAEADRQVLGSLFSESTLSTVHVPKCDVLFVYCKLGSDGRAGGTAKSLGELFKIAASRVAVVASENPIGCYERVALQCKVWKCNYTMVLNRDGQNATLFFRNLFERMFRGETMFNVWRDLSSKSPDVSDADTSALFAIIDAGDIAFIKTTQR